MIFEYRVFIRVGIEALLVRSATEDLRYPGTGSLEPFLFFARELRDAEIRQPARQGSGLLEPDIGSPSIVARQFQEVAGRARTNLTGDLHECGRFGDRGHGPADLFA